MTIKRRTYNGSLAYEKISETSNLGAGKQANKRAIAAQDALFPKQPPMNDAILNTIIKKALKKPQKVSDYERGEQNTEHEIKMFHRPNQ